MNITMGALAAAALLLPAPCPVSAQAAATDSLTEELPVVADTVPSAAPESVPPRHRLRLVHAAVPAVLVGVGIVGLESDWLKYQNSEIRDEMQENIDRKITIDDFTQYVPAAAAFSLDFFGVPSRHDALGRGVTLATAWAFMGIVVNSLKKLTAVERPDGSSRNSFPSGHTATAFMGAELLRLEYRDASPWIGAGGYLVAAGTGFFRMYNNRHWLTDVLAGAGIGILSAQAAWWLYPGIERLMPRRRGAGLSVAPYASGGGGGLACRLVF